MNNFFNKFINIIEKIISPICKGAFLTGTVILLSMMLVTGYSVFMRYIVQNPILGTMELLESMMVLIIFLGLPWTTLKKETMSVSAIVDRLNPTVQKILSIIAHLLGIIMFALIAMSQIKEAQYSLMVLERSDILRIPRYPLYYTIGFGVGMMCLIYIIKFFRIFFPKEAAIEK
jgi:TRAP-type C4-dicarboxylate transport system permease small subunit